MKSTSHLRIQVANFTWSSSIMVLALSLVFSLGARHSTPLAQEHGAGHKEMKESKIEIPTTLSGIWVKVQENQRELHKVLAEKKLDHVHILAFAIRDYVTTMSAKSGDLPKEKQDSLTKSISRIGSLAKFLDEAGDKGDSTSVATYLGKLDKELVSIEALYPAQTLKPKKTDEKAKADAKAKDEGTHGH